MVSSRLSSRLRSSTIMRTGVNGEVYVPPPAVVVVTDPNVTSIPAAGWYAMYTGANLATFNPANEPTYIYLNRQGFDSAGLPKLFTNVPLIITKNVRQAYPNQTLGSTDKAALQDYVYSTDTIVGGSAATNLSTVTSPKPVANWADAYIHKVVNNILEAEIVTGHRDAQYGEEVAAVRFIVSGNILGVPSTRQVVVSAMTISTNGPNDQAAVLVYKGAVDTSEFDDNQQLTLNGQVYPFLGDANSVADSSLSAVEREFSPRYFYKSSVLYTNPPVAYVAPTGGSDTTGVVATASTAASALAAPFATVFGAMKKAKTQNGNDDALEIRLMAGTHTGMGTILSTEWAQANAIIRIVGDPAVNDKSTVIMNFSGARPRANWFEFYRFKFVRTATTQMTSEAATRLVWRDMILDSGGFATAFFSSAGGACYYNGVEAFNTASQNFTAGSSEVRMLRGIHNNSGSFVGEQWLVLGCKIPSSNFGFGTRHSNGAIMAFNQCFGFTSLNGLGESAATGDVSGMLFLQNVFEYVDSVSGTMIRLSGDSGTTNTDHIIFHHNTMAGMGAYGRNNNAYDETTGDPRFHTRWSSRGNIYTQYNTKSDVFKADATRQGNWAVMYGVGFYGDVTQYIDAGGGNSYFGPMYPGVRGVIGTVDAPIEVSYVDPKMTQPGPVAGTGGGDYRLQDESAAASRLSPEMRPLSYGLSGLPRGQFTAAGAYVPLSGDVEVSIDAGGGLDLGTYTPVGADAGTGAALTGASPQTLIRQGVVMELENVASFGTHTDGSYWVVPNHADGIGMKKPYIEATQTTDLFMGGCMIDPGRPLRPDIKKHGFDWRTVGNKTDPTKPISGSGPGNTYDPSYEIIFPRRIKPYADGPTTVWIYRGCDNADLTSGGGASGGANMVQLTVYSVAPAANTIKPPGQYVAGGKPIINRSAINFAALPSLTLPAGAVQPNWDQDFGMHKYPVWRWGNRNESAAYEPKRTTEQYPADQAGFTNMVAIGCCYNIVKRNELIERMVRDGLEAHAGTAFAPGNNAYFAGGGFGPGGKLPRFIAAEVLNNAAMKAQPPQIYAQSTNTGPMLQFFAEDCSTYWSEKKTGDVADAAGTYQALFGTGEVAASNTGPDYIASHTSRDFYHLRDSYRNAQFTWVVESVAGNTFTVTAASHDFTKVYQPHNSTNQGYHRAMRIMTGANAGKWLLGAQKVGNVDVFWNAADRRVTVESTASWALPVLMPAVGDIVEYRPAAVYAQIVSASLAGTALAVVLMGKVTEYCQTEDQRAMFMFVKDHIANGGLQVDKKASAPPFQRSGSAISRTWGPGEAVAMAGKWMNIIYPTVAASWPNFTGPVGG